MSEESFERLLELANENPELGFPSYVLRRGKYYMRHSIRDGQFYFDAIKEKAAKFREYEAVERRRNRTDVAIEVIDDAHTRASNAFWRLQTPYRVVQIRMEGEDKENPANNKFFGITPGGRLIDLHTTIIDQGMTEVFWCHTQEVPWRLFAYVTEFQNSLPEIEQ